MTGGRAGTTGKRPYAARLDPARRRDQLLDVALDILDAGGVAAVSVDAVAKGAGVTRPVVYSQFADANDLIRALLEREAAGALQQLAGVLPLVPAQGEDPAEELARAVGLFLEAIRSRPKRWRALLVPPAGAPPALRQIIADGRAVVSDQLRLLVAWALRQADQDGDPELLALGVLMFMEEAARRLLTDPATFPEERIRAFVEWVLPRLLGIGR